MSWVASPFFRAAVMASTVASTAAYASSTLCYGECAEADELGSLALLQSSGDGFYGGFYGSLSGNLGQAGLSGNGFYKLSFVHSEMLLKG